MQDTLVEFLTERAEGSSFFLPHDVPRTLSELFTSPESTLPHPYKVFFADETLPPILGFPVAESPQLRELNSRVERWMDDEIAWQLKRDTVRDKSQASFAAYGSHLIKLAENAMLSSLLADYHGVFWLAHSADLARQFSAIPKKVAQLDSQAARTQGDAIKYRIYTKWASDTWEQMSKLAARVSGVLEGEEERAIRFFKTLQENLLILTEEFIGPDLRELKSFFSGYLRRDFTPFRETFERIREVASQLLVQDVVFRNALGLLGIRSDHDASTALLLDARFQRFLFDHPRIDRIANRDERDQFQIMSRRVAEFGMLYQLRRGINWMRTTPTGEIVSCDRPVEILYSRSTRPIDFGRLGVVDPMVHRFGLIYDITSFAETLGTIAKTGRKGELSSYRQMLVFQKKIQTIARRNRLQFEKFLGDGAFYTTRRGLRLLRAAVEIQGLYSDMRKKGFAFDRGIRVAVNYGYYRLLPMKGATDSSERSMEFYGPGVVELSRLTTGKATKEIEDIQAFLVAYGYEPATVQQFFAPLATGVDVIDHRMHEREFYAYVDANGHLVNEGIVASLSLLQELSTELSDGNFEIFRLVSRWGVYVGFVPDLEQWDYFGIRLIGNVSLKGLPNVELGEVAAFRASEVEASPFEQREPLVTLLRQSYHERAPVHARQSDSDTQERELGAELILCSTEGLGGTGGVFVMGQWDPLSDEIRGSIEIPRRDLRRLMGVPSVTSDEVKRQKGLLEKVYRKAPKAKSPAPIYLDALRRAPEFVGFLLGETVEEL